MRALSRIVASIVAGWTIGAAGGLAVSKFFYDGKADQLPVFTVPIAIIACYALSFLLVRPRW
ncbi:MAG: hypothetical protein KGP27_09430 [Hyphomicrobiales bacterium]|nr:hypothetical protein [Hyphomicrobiales bacterium]